MANTLEEFSPEMWSNRTQRLLTNSLVSGAIANTEERETLYDGDKVHRPYHSEIYTQDYTKGTDLTVLDIATTDEDLTVDQTPAVFVYLDDIDKKQNKYNTIDKLVTRSAYELRSHIDRNVLAEISNANNNNTAAIFSTANIVSQFSEGKAALANNGVEDEETFFSVINPDIVSVIEQYFGANGFVKQDDILENGYGLKNYLGRWLGLEMFSSNNLRSAVSLGLATNPTGDNTVVLNGVTFTFKASPSSANDVDIGSDAATSVDNLVAAINGAAGAGTTYIALSDSDRAKLKRRGVVATDNTTSIGIVAGGKMTLSETLTDATDCWGTQTIDNLIGQMGCTDLVLQDNVKTEFKNPPKKFGTNILSLALYGKKTFNEGKERMYKLTNNVS